jgi:TrkA family protein
MDGIYFLVPTLFTIAISLLIVRGGAIALMMTGMSFNKAKFQALSAFSGTGFTTREAERVVNNVRRRKIISWLMVMGNAGIVTVIVTATSSFSKVKGMEVGLNVLILLVGLGLIVTITMHTPLVRFWEVFAQKRLARLKVFDEDTTIDELLHIAEGYGVVRIQILEDSSFIGQTLSEINAGLEHLFVLGIERGKEWLPTPRTTRKPKEDDYLVIYGKLEDLNKHFSN